MPLVLFSLDSEAVIPLTKPVMLCGRHPECDIQLESKKISRRHCCIAVVDQHLAVRDLGSMNGIRINGDRVMDGRVQLGDELTIGNLRYKFKLEEKELKQPVNAPPAKKTSPQQLPKPPSSKNLASPSSKVDLLAAGNPTVRGGNTLTSQAQLIIDPDDPLTEQREQD